MAAYLPPPLVLTYIYLFRMIAVCNLKNSSNVEATDLFHRNKAKIKCPYESEISRVSKVLTLLKLFSYKTGPQDCFKRKQSFEMHIHLTAKQIRYHSAMGLPYLILLKWI